MMRSISVLSISLLAAGCDAFTTSHQTRSVEFKNDLGQVTTYALTDKSGKDVVTRERRQGDDIESVSYTIDDLQTGCENGKVESCFELGIASQYAIKIFASAASQGPAHAGTCTLKAAEEQESCRADAAAKAAADDQALRSYVAQAVHSFETACDANHGSACLNLGVLHEQGEGVAQDLEKAAAFYQRACDAGHASGCFNTGVLHENGEGVAQDLERAVALYQRACDAGHASGCFNTGVLHQKGEGVAQDLAKAAVLYQRACDAGLPRACN